MKFLKFVLFSGLLVSSLVSQSRPVIYIGSNSMGKSPGSPCKAYVASPDTMKIIMDAGKARAGRPAGFIVTYGLLSSPIPIGPDKLEIDISTLLFADFIPLDSNGHGEVSFPVPGGITDKTMIYIQGFVVPAGEPWPFRLSGLVKIEIYAGSKHFFVDGDVSSNGNGTPYNPFKTISSASAAAKTAGGGIIHVDPLNSGVYAEVVELFSNTTLIGDSWRSGTGVKPEIRAPIDSSGDKKRGSVVAMGTATAPLNNVTIKNLKILPSRKTGTYYSKCIALNYVKNSLVEDCIFEGTSRNGGHGVRALKIMTGVTGTISHCTFRNLNADPSVKHDPDAAIVGIGIFTDDQITIRNCRMENFGNIPLSNGVQAYFVFGIKASANKPGTAKNVINVYNNVIGPFVIPKGKKLGLTDINIYGIDFGNGTKGSIRNNVFYMLDARKFEADTSSQVFGIFCDKAGTVEVTNNIIQDLHHGPATGSVKVAIGFVSLSNSYTVTYSCVWNVKTPFSGYAVKGTGTILKDPLLSPPVFTLKPGSPCLGTGNPLYPPKNMGIFGGKYAGPAGAR